MKLKCRKRLPLVVLAFGVGLCATIACQAKTIYVETNGLDSRTGEGDWTNAVKTIATGVAKATAVNDVVLISNGTYAVTASIAVGNITVRGLNGYTNTVADGGGANQVFNILAGATVALIEGLTLSNGYSAAGAGVYMGGGTVRNCAIVNCKTASPGDGGGVYLGAANGRVEQCLIKGNSAYGTGGRAYGAGVYMLAGVVTGCVIKGNYSQQYGIVADNGAVGNNGVIENCTISENSADGGGTGISILSSGVIRQCMINNNSAPNGGAAGVYLIQGNGGNIYDSWIISNKCNSAQHGSGIYIGSTNSEIRNCLIAYNQGATAIRFDAGYSSRLINCTIVSNISATVGIFFYIGGAAINCISYYNTGTYANYYISTGNAVTGSFNYSCTTPLPAYAYGTNNTAEPPLFVSQETGNFRLGRGSPCIDQGTNMGWMATAMDLDGRARLNLFRRQVDMGAYEYVPAGMMMMVP